MLTLYDHVESPCCQKVRLMMAEKQISFQAVWVDIEKGDNLRASYLALNPKAQVPVLVHEVEGEKIVITESTVICEYLEDCFPERPLFPRKPAERAAARKWASLVDTGIHMPYTAAITFTIALRDELLKVLDTPEKKEAYLEGIRHPVNREVRKLVLEQGFESPYFLRALESFDEMFQMMEAQLERARWLGGDSFSYVDIVIAPYIKRFLLLDLGEMLVPYPTVLSWFESLTRRESWQTEIAAKDAAFVARIRANSEGAWEKVKPLLR